MKLWHTHSSRMSLHTYSRRLFSIKRSSPYVKKSMRLTQSTWGSGGRVVERRTVNRGDGGSIPPTAVSKLRQFRSRHIACVFRKRL